MRNVTLVAVLVALPPASARAQWTAGIELGGFRYRGSAYDTTTGGGSGPPTFRPGDATTIGGRVQREIGPWAAALRVSYGKPGLAGTGGNLTISDKSLGRLIEGATLVGRRAARVGAGGSVRMEAGPVFHFWKLDDEIRFRVGALGALIYTWPVAGRFSGTLRTEGSVSRSWFDAGDLPPEYERRPTWRYGVTLGLRYRL